MNYEPLDTLPTPVLVIALPGAKILHLNPTALREWGYANIASEGLDFAGLIVPTDEANAAALARFLAGHDGLVVRLAADVATGDGGRRRYQFVARAGVEEEPQVGLLAAVDVSEQDAVFRALEDDARHLRALVESNFDAYYVWHIAAGYHEWSPQLDAWLGLPPGVHPHTYDFWISRLHPSQREAALAHYEACVRERRPYEDEYLFRREDGEYLLIADRGILLFDEQGEPTQLVGVMRDVTEERGARRALEESETLYRTLFQATNNPALRTDKMGHCIEANEAASQLLGLSREELLLTAVDDHFGDQAMTTLQKLTEAEGERFDAVSVELRAGQGEEERVLATSVVPSQVGERVTYFWLSTDVTDLRRLNEALAQSRQLLRAEVTAREEYAAALKVILEQVRQERVDGRRAILADLDRLVAPMLDRLERSLEGRPEAAYLEAVRQTLADIASSVGGTDADAAGPMPGPLTRKELEIAQLVKLGKSTDEIASILHISSATVSYHRKSIRGKFGITKKRVRLDRYLLDAEARG